MEKLSDQIRDKSILDNYQESKYAYKEQNNKVKSDWLDTLCSPLPKESRYENNNLYVPYNNGQQSIVEATLAAALPASVSDNPQLCALFEKNMQYPGFEKMLGVQMSNKWSLNYNNDKVDMENNKGNIIKSAETCKMGQETSELYDNPPTILNNRNGMTDNSNTAYADYKDQYGINMIDSNWNNNTNTNKETERQIRMNTFPNVNRICNQNTEEYYPGFANKTRLIGSEVELYGVDNKYKNAESHKIDQKYKSLCDEHSIKNDETINDDIDINTFQTKNKNYGKRNRQKPSSPRLSHTTIPAGKLIADAAELPIVPGVRWSSKYLRFEVQFSNATTSFSAKTAGVTKAFTKALTWLKIKKDDVGTSSQDANRRKNESQSKKNSFNPKYCQIQDDTLNAQKSKPNYETASANNTTTLRHLQLRTSPKTVSNHEDIDEVTSNYSTKKTYKKHKNIIKNNYKIPTDTKTNISTTNDHGHQWTASHDLLTKDLPLVQDVKTENNSQMNDLMNDQLYLEKLSLLICVDDLSTRCIPQLPSYSGLYDENHDYKQIFMEKHVDHIARATEQIQILPYLELFSSLIRKNELPSMLSRDTQVVLINALKMLTVVGHTTNIS